MRALAAKIDIEFNVYRRNGTGNRNNIIMRKGRSSRKHVWH